MKGTISLLLFISSVLCMLPYNVLHDERELERFFEQLWNAIESDLNEHVNILQHRNERTWNNAARTIDHDSRYYKGMNGFDYDAFINEIDNRYNIETNATKISSNWVWLIGYSIISFVA